MTTLGVPGSPTYSQTLSGIDEMMIVLPDNNQNQIAASDVRNVVLTLYEEIQGLSSSVSSSVGFTFSNTNLTTTSVGGISTNSNLYGKTLQQIFDLMFYPYVRATLSLTANPSIIEFGNTSSLVNLTWYAKAGSQKINNLSIIRPTIPNTITVASNITGGLSASGTLSGNITIPNTTTNYSLRVLEDVTGTTYSVSTSVSWINARYYGVYNLSSYGNPNLTLNPGSASILSSVFTDIVINSLSKELNSSRLQGRTMTGGGSYLVFAWPTINNPGTPTFFTDSPLPNTAFTKIRSNSPMVNVWGYTANYDVWISNVEYYTATVINII